MQYDGRTSLCSALSLNMQFVNIEEALTILGMMLVGHSNRKHCKTRPMPNLPDHAKGHSIDLQFLLDCCHCCHPRKGIDFSDQYTTMLKWTKGI